MADPSSPESADEAPARPRTEEESYLYEKVIDALIAFLARYLRTVVLLLRNTGDQEARLIRQLMSDSPAYTRPLAFAAITYLMLVTVVDRVLGFASSSDFFEATDLVLSTFGDADRDTLLLAILVPLPPLVIIAGLTHGAANSLAEATREGREQLAALMQYAVGQGLTTLVAYLLLMWALAMAMDTPVVYDIVARGRDVEGLISTAFTVVVIGGVLAAFLVSTPPVWRAIGVLPGVPTLPKGRRAAFSLLGPTIMAATIGGMAGLLAASEELSTEAVSLEEVSLSVSGPDSDGWRVLEGTALVEGTGDRPLAITGAKLALYDPGVTAFACSDLEGTSDRASLRVGPSKGPPPVLAIASITVLNGPDWATEAGLVPLTPGDAQWVHIEARVPGDAAIEPRHWCLHSAKGGGRWHDAT